MGGLFLALDELCWLDRYQVSDGPSQFRQLPQDFELPREDLGQLLERLGIKLFARERTLAQYVAWSLQNGLIEFIAVKGSATAGEVEAGTPLSEAGADSLLGVLCALGLVDRKSGARFALRPMAREYLLMKSPFYIGDQIASTGLSIPRPYLKENLSFGARWKLWSMKFYPSLRYGSPTRLDNQHARNLAACAAAVRTGEFSATKCIVDIAGGTGTFAIPCALDNPNSRVILTDLPETIRNVRNSIDQHPSLRRLEFLNVNALTFPWRLPPCDGVFMGNFLHGFGDDICKTICREAHDRLDSGGRLWIHEILWNENKDGPLLSALWHAAMRSAGPGRQRTANELSQLLVSAGFSDIRVTRTAGCFALVSGRKGARQGVLSPM